jgi:DeoR/GlpR family transcriptional regulator of sugar metabolism
MTIRRDLDVLAAAGLVEKVHGGATVPSSEDRSEELRSSEEPGFEKKSAEQIAEKVAIAARAVRLVRHGSAIGLTAGTTTWHLAHLLGEVRDLVVVTNSIRVAEVIYSLGRPDHTVVVTGGVRTPSDALVGPLAEHALGTVHLDQVFMGVHGMSKRAGYTTPNLLEAGTNRAFISASQRLVVVADRTKWATVGISTIARLGEAHILVTDEGLDPAAVAALRAEIADVQLAAAPAEAAATKRKRV